MNYQFSKSISGFSLIDCHSHLDGFSNNEVGEILKRAHSVGVEIVVSAGTTLTTSRRAVLLAHQYPSLFAAVGIHPTDVSDSFNEEDARSIAELAESDNVVAISEIGLDFQETSPDRAIQYKAFRSQIGVAREAGLPIIFHSRNAASETLRVLREERGFEVGGAMHYFQGDIGIAFEALDLGFHISLARPLLHLPELQSVAASVPLSWIVLETDAYPQPFKKNRDRWTEPRHVAQIAHELARLKLLDISEVAEETTANALRMLGSKGYGLANNITAKSN